MRSQYPTAQSRPQRPDWRVSLTTQERPRRPSSPGSRAEPSRAGRPGASWRLGPLPAGACRGRPAWEWSLREKAPRVLVPSRVSVPVGDASPFFGPLVPGSQAPDRRVVALPATVAPTLLNNTGASRAPAVSPVLPASSINPPLYSPRPGPREERTSRGHASPALRESWPLWVSREAWKRRAPRPQAGSAAGGAGRPAPAAEHCGPAPPLGAGGEGRWSFPVPPRPSSRPASPGSSAGRRYHPLLARHFLSSPPR